MTQNQKLMCSVTFFIFNALGGYFLGTVACNIWDNLYWRHQTEQFMEGVVK